MEDKKSKSKTLKGFIRKFDFFGEYFAFRYKDEDKQSSVSGGIVCIVFYIIAIIYFLYNFIPFINHEIFSLQYYTIGLNETEHLNIKEDKIMFAFGLTVNDKFNFNILYDYYLDIKVTFKDKFDESNKIEIYPRLCVEEDFPEELRDKFYSFKLEHFLCISKKNLSDHVPEGIFTHSKFLFYTITVQKKDYGYSYDSIKNYLLENDCKLQFYYTDISLDLSNKLNPNTTFLNSLFLQLDPTVIQKKNVFYMNYHLYDDDSFIHVGLGKEKSKDIIGFSRAEDYSVYIGENRDSNRNKDKYAYAKLYIRVDNKKIVIKRRYQDFMEFYADTSALLLSLFWILGVLFAYYDKTVADYSISKKLFDFEGIKGNKFHQFKIFKELLDSKEALENNEQEQKINNTITYAARTNTESRIIKNNFIRRNTCTQLKDSIKEKKDEKDLIDYSSYNMIDMFLSFKIFFCKKEKLKNKINLIKKAKKIIDRKLDVVFYIKNMLLFELINKIYLENKSILNFLSRPIIYLKDIKVQKSEEIDLNDIKTEASCEIYDEKEEKRVNEKNEIEIMEYFEGDLYKTAYNLESNVLSEKIANLVLKPGKTSIQKKLIKSLKHHLKGA